MAATSLLSLLLLRVTPLALFSECPGAGCPGTAVQRQSAAVRRIAAADLSTIASWEAWRRVLVASCGLKVQRSTSHCFNDFNHVDCCAMETSHSHRTNEESRVPGMHAVNQLGPHIVDGSLDNSEFGTGGSWCTCQLGTPRDVCHRQFGAEVAFKLLWCPVPPLGNEESIITMSSVAGALAVIVDEWGNLLNQRRFRPDGRPFVGGIPTHRGPAARAQAWDVIAASRNGTMRMRWEDACARATRLTARPAAATHSEL